MSLKYFTFDYQGTEVRVYVGDPKKSTHPFYHQNSWLGKERGINIPADIMKAAEELHKIAIENNLSFADLYFFAINSSKLKNKMQLLQAFLANQSQNTEKIIKQNANTRYVKSHNISNAQNTTDKKQNQKKRHNQKFQ